MKLFNEVKKYVYVVTVILEDYTTKYHKSQVVRNSNSFNIIVLRSKDKTHCNTTLL